MTSGLVARARRLMMISLLTTCAAIAAVTGVVGYRVFRAGGSASGASAEVVVALPKGARVIATALAADRLVVTLDVGGATEIRTFDLKTLKQNGRLSFATAP